MSCFRGTATRLPSSPVAVSVVCGRKVRETIGLRVSQRLSSRLRGGRISPFE